ncbi:polysaccharide deacetylase family protein [Exiguobacterium sp.]|uniref:polysaccharide deacetylase family protein n=1 Tax=Exiguobacterium sp. TaxID=44751 RepID=UPI00263BBA4D|nr:polysaccharide deacetylase family protein [Exiguobacterium sp.]MCC5891121.1 polysaccharide deacetylase family protein [Exiguobacterium sp.]
MKRNLLLVMLILLGLGTWYYMAGAAPTTKKVPAPSFTGKYPGLYLTVESEQTRHYTMAVSVPKTDHDALNETLDTFIKEKKEGFQERLTVSRGQQGHLNIQTDSFKTSESSYTLVLQTYAFTGGANGQSTVDVFHLDIEAGKFLEWGDVFHDDEDTLTWFQTTVAEQLHRNEYVFEELVEEALSDPKTTKWMLTSSGLTVWFDEYEVAAGAAGVVEVNIPLEDVTPYVSKQISEQSEDNIEETTVTPSRPPLDPDGKYVALTFDDGPHPTVTPKVLEALEAYDARATFFMLGSQIEFYPDVAKAVASAGHELANHTEHHPNLAQLPLDGIEAELESVDQRIEQLVGERAKLVRPPYGAKNEEVERVIEMRGQTLALWTVDSLDWSHRNPSEMHKLIVDGVHPSAVVLMHDIHASTAEGLPRVLATLEREGYEFVTMSELLTIQ